MEKIKELKDLHNWLKKIHNDSCDDLFFRGHANSKWEIKPFLFREKYNEFELLNLAKTRGWAFLKECHSELEMLITLQHYGLPTRLLDVTTNPLIALYFACQEEQKSTDGCVLWGHHHYSDSRILAEIIARFIFMPDTGNVLTNKQMNFLKNDLKSQGYEVKSCRNYFSKPLFFNPPFNNSRIIAQSGAFLMAALVENTYKNSNLYFKNIKCESFPYISNMFEKEYAIVPAENKERLLCELDECGINQAFLFPDLQNLTAYIKNKYEMSKGYELDVNNSI